MAKLWIAFKLYFYQVHWQLIHFFLFIFCCCELLSNCIFIRFIDNNIAQRCSIAAVVNCFQIVFLSGSLTTRDFFGFAPEELWIAFKLYFYQVHWQLRTFSLINKKGCELLSNCIFIRFIDNTKTTRSRKKRVVNCFQIVFLSGSLTTLLRFYNQDNRLWIAFKLYFYQVHWQQRGRRRKYTISCELLSNCIFIRFIDNNGDIIPWHGALWIAFKLYFYQVHWQVHS